MKNKLKLVMTNGLNNQSYSKICCGQASQRDVGFSAKTSLCFHGNYYQTIQYNCERTSEDIQSSADC